MLEFTFTHTLHCSTDRFWELFLSEAFTKELILDGLGFAACEVGPTRTDGEVRFRDMTVVPKLDLPGPVARLLGPKLGYTEHGRFDVSTQTWKYQLVLSVMSDRIRMGGTVTTTPTGPGQAHCLRQGTHWVDVRILGVGGLAERAAQKNMADGWDRSAAWMNRWFTNHPSA